MPLRKLYLSNDDRLIYAIILNFFIAIEKLFNGDDNLFPVFHKTAGVTALFKVLQMLLIGVFKNDAVDLSSAMWIECFSSQQRIVDFNDSSLFGSSGSHAGKIRDMLLLMAGHKKLEDFNGKDCYSEYKRLWTNAKVITNA